MSPLFTVPIAPCDPHPGGRIVCTEPESHIYLLTFTSPPDNRLVTPFCKAMLTALDILEFGYPPGVVITTSAIQKFYSNGLDLDHAQEVEGYWTQSLYAMWKRFLT
jgi:Delta3-Delta2-enoyl-CoA isomerase